MAKYTFTCEHKDGTKVTYETTQYNVHQLLVDFEQFLRGAGFDFDARLTFENQRESLDEIRPIFTEKCEKCGIDKNVMRCHACYDIECPKDIW